MPDHGPNVSVMPNGVGGSPVLLCGPSHGRFGRGRRVSIPGGFGEPNSDCSLKALPLKLVAPSRLANVSAASASRRSSVRMAAPLWRAPITCCTPPIQKNGLMLSTRPGNVVSSPCPTIGAVLRTTAPCVWTTPLGSAVVPEVNTTTIGSAGVTSASTASRSASSIPSIASPASRGVISECSAHERSVGPSSRTERR